MHHHHGQVVGVLDSHQTYDAPTTIAMLTAQVTSLQAENANLQTQLALANAPAPVVTGTAT